MDTSEEREATETKTAITPELVDRVSERRAMGMPLKVALAGEGVTCGDYEMKLKEDPKLAGREHLAKRRFLERALTLMLNGKDAAGNFRWLIERVYKDVIGSKEDEPEEEHQTILGVPEHVLNEARRQALLAPEWRPGMDE